MRFSDRVQAGRLLARFLIRYRDRDDLVILGLPRGGIPVAYEVAHHLRAPLDVVLVRKLGVPWLGELAMGAIASGGLRILNREIISELDISDAEIEAAAERESRRIDEQEARYRSPAGALELRGKCIILVDDGVATGATMRVAALAVRSRGPALIVAAAPVGTAEAREMLERDRTVDDVVFVTEPDRLASIGGWYDDFSQTSDQEVRRLLAEARQAQPGGIRS